MDFEGATVDRADFVGLVELQPSAEVETQMYRLAFQIHLTLINMVEASTVYR